MAPKQTLARNNDACSTNSCYRFGFSVRRTFPPMRLAILARYSWDKSTFPIRSGFQLTGLVSLPAEFAAMIKRNIARSREDIERALKLSIPILLSPLSHAYFDVPYAEASADPPPARHVNGLPARRHDRARGRRAYRAGHHGAVGALDARCRQGLCEEERATADGRGTQAARVGRTGTKRGEKSE